MKNIVCLLVVFISTLSHADVPDYRKLFVDNQTEFQKELTDAQKIIYNGKNISGVSISGSECQNIFASAKAISGNPWKVITDELSSFCKADYLYSQKQNGTTQLGLSYDTAILTTYSSLEPYEYYVFIDSSKGVVVESGFHASGKKNWVTSVANENNGFTIKSPYKDQAFYSRAGGTLQAYRVGLPQKASKVRVEITNGDQSYLVFQRTNGDKENCFAGTTAKDNQKYDYYPDVESFESCSF